MDDKGDGFYLLRFPWSVHWGDFGYMKFAKKGASTYYTKNTCGIYNVAYTMQYQE